MITTQDNKYNIKERKSTTYIIQETQTIEPITYPTRWRTRTERLKKRKKKIEKRARGGPRVQSEKSFMHGFKRNVLCYVCNSKLLREFFGFVADLGSYSHTTKSEQVFGHGGQHGFCWLMD